MSCSCKWYQKHTGIVTAHVNINYSEKTNLQIQFNKNICISVLKQRFRELLLIHNNDHRIKIYVPVLRTTSTHPEEVYVMKGLGCVHWDKSMLNDEKEDSETFELAMFNLGHKKAIFKDKNIIMEMHVNTQYKPKFALHEHAQKWHMSNLMALRSFDKLPIQIQDIHPDGIFYHYIIATGNMFRDTTKENCFFFSKFDNIVNPAGFSDLISSEELLIIFGTTVLCYLDSEEIL